MIRRTVPNDCGGKYWFDASAADAAVAFYRDKLTLTTAEWAGKPFVLSPLQEQIIRDLFGWKRTSDGLRRFRICYVWVPRKWGKSEWAAGAGLLLLLGDDEPAAEVYCIAANDTQARICYDRAVKMVVNSDEMSEAMTPFADMIWYHDQGSKLQPLTGKPRGKHGLVAQGIIADECHEWADDELYTFVHQSEANRRQPMDLFISTAGKKQGPGWEFYQLSEALLEGSAVDESAYVVIASADPQKDKDDPNYWTTPEAWAEANPNYPITPKHAYLESECARAQLSPRLENNFKKYHLNLWVEQDVRWLNMARWDECAQTDWRTMARRMAGRECVVGIDMSAVADLTAEVYVFPPVPADPVWTVLPYFYIPRARLNDRVRVDKQPFDKWNRDRAVYAMNGDVIDQRVIRRHLIAASSRFSIRQVMIDRWNATQFAVELGGDGFSVQFFGQGYASMSGPSKALEKLTLMRRIDHGGHPVLRWCATNAAVTQDAADNIKPAKDKSVDRIDGIVAEIMGIGGCDEYLTGPQTLWEIASADE